MMTLYSEKKKIQGLARLAVKIKKDSHVEMKKYSLSASGSDANFDTRVTILGELTGEELVQFGVENTISNLT